MLKKAVSPLTVYCCAVVLGLVMLFAVGVRMHDDSGSYACWYVFAAGNPDIMRTPVYPWVLHAFGIEVPAMLNSPNALGVIALQWGVWLVAVKYLMGLVGLLGGGRLARFAAGMACVCCYSMFRFNNYILSESLSCSAVVFFVYFTVAAYLRGKMAYAAVASWWLLIMVGLRPVFIYVLPIWLLMWIWAWVRRPCLRRTALVAAGGVALSVSVTWLYSLWVERTYDIFSPTAAVAAVNPYIMARQQGWVGPEYFEDKAMRDLVAGNLVGGPGLPSVYVAEMRSLRGYGPEWCYDKVLAVARDATAAHRSEYLAGLARRAWWAKDDSCFVFSIETLYYFLPAFLGWLAIRHRRREPVWPLLLVWAMVAGNLAAVLVGAPADWSRLLAPSVALVMVMCVIVIRPLAEVLMKRKNMVKTC